MLRYGLAQLNRLRAVVLLAGSVRANHLRKQTGRRALEMPVTDRHTVFDGWREQLLALAERLGVDRLPVRVMVDQASRTDTLSRSHGPIELTIESDPLDFRGTGGLLSDIAADYDDDDLLLVGHASQVLFEPLTVLAATVAGSSDDVALVCGRDGTPGGLMLVRCGCLRSVNRVGYIDLNEQALPAIAGTHDVRVVRYDRPVTRSVRTLHGYVAALRQFHLDQCPPADANRPEVWQSSFAIVEPGAKVHPTALLHDTVVLDGGRVEADAVVVRSVVCRDGVVPIAGNATDRVVSRRP